MNFFEGFLLVLHVGVALAICGFVLLQHGKGADMGAAFGSGASGSLFGASFTGVVTDSMCATSHGSMKMGPDPDCIKACVKDHNSKYALLVGKQVYKLSDQQTPAAFAGKKAAKKK